MTLLGNAERSSTHLPVSIRRRNLSNVHMLILSLIGVLSLFLGSLIPFTDASAAQDPTSNTPVAPEGATSTIPSGTGPLAAGSADPQSDLSLIDQTPWITGGNPFTMNIGIGKNVAIDDVDLVVTVFGTVRNRTAFQRSVDDTISGNPVVLERRTLRELITPANTATVTLPVGDATMGRYFLRNTGVYPVRVELRSVSSDDAVATFVTHLINIPGTNTINKLSVATALPVSSPSSAPDNPFLTPDNGANVRTVASALSASSVPVAVVPDPSSIERLTNAAAVDDPAVDNDVEGQADEEAAGTVGVLANAVKEREVIASPWSPLSPLLYGDSFRNELDRQFVRGRSVVDTAIKPPTTTLFAGLDPLNAGALSNLRARGVQHFVVPETTLTPVTRTTSLARPFALSLGRNNGTVVAAQADAGLSSHFGNPVQPRLAAYQLLADLAVVWNDLPAQDRGVVVMPDRNWLPNADFLSIYLNGLATSPLVTAVSFDEFFDLPPEGGTGRTQLIRSLGALSDDATTPISTDRVSDARMRTNALLGMLSIYNPAAQQLEQRLLLAEGPFRREDERDEWFDSYDDASDAIVDAVLIPAERSIRLTARQGEIPVSIQNDTGYPISVVVHLTSNKVIFPDGAERSIEVERAQVTERFAVDARTSGAFPVRVSVESPDGGLVLVDSEITVRSTAASGVGVGLTVGAGLFLIFWWLRSVIRTRKQRE